MRKLLSCIPGFAVAEKEKSIGNNSGLNPRVSLPSKPVPTKACTPQPGIVQHRASSPVQQRNVQADVTSACNSLSILVGPTAWSSHICACSRVVESSLGCSAAGLVLFGTPTFPGPLSAEANGWLCTADGAEGGQAAGCSWPAPSGEWIGLMHDQLTTLTHTKRHEAGSAAVVLKLGRSHMADPAITTRPVPLSLSAEEWVALPLHDRAGRLAASLVLGWGVQTDLEQSTACATGRQGEPQQQSGGSCLVGSAADGPMSLSAGDLTELHRLAQFLSYGLFTDPGHTQFLSRAAGHLSAITAGHSLHDAVAAVLDAVPDLLQYKLGLTAQPMLAATTQNSTGSAGSGAVLPAVVFTRRAGPNTDTDTLEAPTPRRASNPNHMKSAASIRFFSSAGPDIEGAAAGGGFTSTRPSRIKAVRVPVGGTLLLETLSRTPMQTHMTSQDHAPALMQDHALPTGAMRTGTASNQPPSSRQPPTVVALPDASSHVLDEQQAHRDVLLAGGLLGPGASAGSLLLCVEGGSSPWAAAAGRPHVLPLPRTCSGLLSSGRQPGGPPAYLDSLSGSAAVSGAVEAAGEEVRSRESGAVATAVATAAQLLTPGPGQLALYVVFAEVLPCSALNAVQAELEAFMPLVFSAFRAARLAAVPAAPAVPSSRNARQLLLMLGLTRDPQRSTAGGGLLSSRNSSAVTSFPLSGVGTLLLEDAALMSTAASTDHLISTMRSRLMNVQDDPELSRTALNQDLASIELLDVLGHGGQGVVFRGTLHGLEVAVKVLEQKKPQPTFATRMAAASNDGEGAAGCVQSLGPPGAALACGGEKSNADVEAVTLEVEARKAKRSAMELAVAAKLIGHPHIVQVYAVLANVVVVRQRDHMGVAAKELKLCTVDDPILGGIIPDPVNQILCLEFCDAGSLRDAAHLGAFRLPGSNPPRGPDAGTPRPALVPLYTSLLEVALALRHLHSKRLVHCDVKAANVLLKSSVRDRRGWSCKLSDFGCVRMMNEEGLDGQPGFRIAHPHGTVPFMAPECLTGPHVLLSPAVDCYAFGMMMWELISGRTPYEGLDQKEIPGLVVRRRLRPEFHPLSPLPYCQLAMRCWSTDPQRRPTSTQLVTELQVLLRDAQQHHAVSSLPYLG